MYAIKHKRLYIMTCHVCFSDDGTIGPSAVEVKKEERSLEGALVFYAGLYLM